jgi:hypothetical protein
MHEKKYNYKYGEYNFYADNADDMLTKITQLRIVAMDRNFLLKKYKEATTKEDKDKYYFELQCAKKQYRKLRKKLEDKYDD